MCDECVDLDKTISRYRDINRNGFDPLTTERINKAIEEMEQRKLTLHSMS